MSWMDLLQVSCFSSPFQKGQGIVVTAGARVLLTPAPLYSKDTVEKFTVFPTQVMQRLKNEAQILSTCWYVC